MADLVKASEPFRLCTRLHLSELTGLEASTLTELLELRIAELAETVKKIAKKIAF